MANTILIGAQWGDEGKGKIIDVLMSKADVVVRSQGGNNAGHTIVHAGSTYILHVIPYHRLLDEQRELRQGRAKIGTTKRGIGPAYGDKAARTGLRISDLMQPRLFSKKLQAKNRENNAVLRALGAKPNDFRDVNQQYLAAGAALLPFVANTVVYLHRALQSGREILFEGAQGTFLDIDHGTYPYVTSSNTTAGGACTGSGVPPHRMDRVLGVMKAYTTRVGEGALPTEDMRLTQMLHN